MTEQLEKKIGFDQIREYLRQRCLSPLGIEHVEQMHWQTDFSGLKQELELVGEMMLLLQLPDTFPAAHYYDCRNTLEKAKIEGAILEESQLRDLKLAMQTINQILLFLKKNKNEQLFRLAELASEIRIDIDLLKKINKIIDESGKIRDTASKELFNLRQDLRMEQSSLRKRLENMLQMASADGLAPDDMSITVRNGRMVVPLFAEYKRKWKGLIHGESATGQTVFIEPLEVFEANNRIYELENEERREMLRILRHITLEIQAFVPELQQAFSFLGKIDFLRAKAAFSIYIKASVPTLVAEQTLQWVQVRHPLLEISVRAHNKTVVPLTLQLPENTRMLVISGPNAGGKSVVLKTIGLLQYMVQTGLPVPGGEQSLCGIFHDLYLDIGDQQSLENDLSTYSSHLLYMKQVLVRAGKKSLVLLDEFGTGTDPQYGGALAEAMLQELLHAKAWVVVNTHYANIKKFASKTQGVENASMLFDTETLNPLYVLQMGKPGHSFAFEIAQKIGLPQRIIEKATQLVGTKQVQADTLMHQLSIEKERLNKEFELIQKERENLKTTARQYEALKMHVEKTKAEILEKARQDARKIISEAKTEMQALIKELKVKSSYDAKSVEKIRDTVHKKLQQIETKDAPKNMLVPVTNTAATTSSSLKEGDWVMIKGKEGYFKVLELRERDATIALGELHTIVKRDALVKITGQPGVAKTSTPKTVLRGIDITDRLAHFQHTIDLRGRRAEDALMELDTYIDNALLLGVYEVRIVHGKGEGILRKVIREHLKRSPYVADVRKEAEERGGDGVSIVRLK